MNESQKLYLKDLEEIAEAAKDVYSEACKRPASASDSLISWQRLATLYEKLVKIYNGRI